jgi:hypothetical protein
MPLQLSSMSSLLFSWSVRILRRQRYNRSAKKDCNNAPADGPGHEVKHRAGSRKKTYRGQDHGANQHPPSKRCGSAFDCRPCRYSLVFCLHLHPCLSKQLVEPASTLLAALCQARRRLHGLLSSCLDATTLGPGGHRHYTAFRVTVPFPERKLTVAFLSVPSTSRLLR